MSILAEIEAAAEALPREQKEELLRFLAARLRPVENSSNNNTPPTPGRARLVVRQERDVLLEAAPDAPPMTPETIKRMLEDWP